MSELVERLKKLEQDATPAPWNVGRADVGRGWQPQIWPELGAPIALMELREGIVGRDTADAALIAEVRNNLPVLLEAAEALGRLVHTDEPMDGDWHWAEAVARKLGYPIDDD